MDQSWTNLFSYLRRATPMAPVIGRPWAAGSSPDATVLMAAALHVRHPSGARPRRSESDAWSRSTKAAGGLPRARRSPLAVLKTTTGRRSRRDSAPASGSEEQASDVGAAAVLDSSRSVAPARPRRSLRSQTVTQVAAAARPAGRRRSVRYRCSTGPPPPVRRCAPAPRSGSPSPSSDQRAWRVGDGPRPASAASRRSGPRPGRTRPRPADRVQERAALLEQCFGLGAGAVARGGIPGVFAGGRSGWRERRRRVRASSSLTQRTVAGRRRGGYV